MINSKLLLLDHHISEFDMEYNYRDSERDYIPMLNMICSACGYVEDEKLYGEIYIELNVEIKSDTDSTETFGSVNVKAASLFIDEAATDKESMEASLKTNGIAMLLPIIRGKMVASAAALGFPFSVAFPDVGINKIKWEQRQ